VHQPTSIGGQRTTNRRQSQGECTGSTMGTEQVNTSDSSGGMIIFIQDIIMISKRKHLEFNLIRDELLLMLKKRSYYDNPKKTYEFHQPERIILSQNSY
jgi:hypothetical protein